jgi:Kef-type K+ transport system membrane component KefB
MGVFHPYFPYKAVQTARQEQATSALSQVSSGLRMGTFVSPFFFLYAGSLARVTNIREEFLLTALILCATMTISALVFSRRKPIEPAKSPKAT